MERFDKKKTPVLIRDKLPFSEIVKEAVKKIKQPLLLYGISESALLISLLLCGKDIPKGMSPIVYTLAGLIVFIAIGHFTLEFYRGRPIVEELMDRILRFREKNESFNKDSEAKNEIKIFPSSAGHEFRKYIEDRLFKAQHLVLIGTGISILHDDAFAKKVMDRAANGELDLEIYLANPYSPDVETRLIEEELGKKKPSVGRNGLIKYLDSFLDNRDKVGAPDSIKINLFSHYPTFALIIIDRKEYLVYPYGYATLGNFSPVFRLSEENQGDLNAIKFFREQYDLIKENVQDAKTIRAIRRHEFVEQKKLYPFALYFIPSNDSSLYQFGSKVLGYDVREGKHTSSPWEKYVGGAKDFGFHITLCDVLYFLKSTDVKIAKAEIEYLAQGFRPFQVIDLVLRDGFPDSKSASIVMRDSTGSLEALNCELIHRVYRRAVASSYSLGLCTRHVMDNERSKLMIDRYYAPYIIQQYVPHFTLLTQLEPEKSMHIVEKIKREFLEQVKEKAIKVDRLAIMFQPDSNGEWKIEKEIVLGG